MDSKIKKLISMFLVFFIVTAAFPVLSGFDKVIAESTNNKHVINIVWDGLSADLFSRLKASGLQTPNIDELINNGTKLDNVRATIPSYGGTQAALVTGASPETNGFLYRYYNKDTGTVKADVYNIYGQTIFESIIAQNPEIKTLASGMIVANKSLNGRGVYLATDPNYDGKHTLIQYALGDNLISFNTVSDDIINSINGAPDNMQDYILAYSNDIKMYYWSRNASDTAATEQAVKDIITGLDAKLGDVVNALKSKGIYDDTIIILNSLSSMYAVSSKLAAVTMAANITSTTGVKTEFTSGIPAADTKAVIVKTYIMKYGQLSFTSIATQEDRDKVLAYLNDKTTSYGQYVKQVWDPAAFNAPDVYADYLIELVDNMTFSQATTGYGRTDTLSDLNQFCVVSGTGVIKNAAVNLASVSDIASNVSYLLGINAPANNEGSLWNIYDFTDPQLVVTLDGQKNVDGLYESSVTVTLDGTDNGGQVLLQYDTGDGYEAYTVPFVLNTDCTLKVRVVDSAGNVTEQLEDIQFIKLLENVNLEGDYNTVNDITYTDSESIMVSGSVSRDNDSLIVLINGEQVAVDAKAFTQEVNLQEGENNITVNVTLNGIGNTQTLTVYRVYNPRVTSIADGATVSEPLVVIGGTVVPGSSVVANGASAVVDENGSFSAQVDLVEGENSILVVSTSGKYVKQTDLTVTYYKPAVITITNLVDKKVVKTQMVTVEGTVDKVCDVKVNGVDVIVRGNKSFSCEVKLNKGVNEITVDTDYNGVTSSKTIQVVYVLPNDNYVVYINWDGFAQYYYELANQENTTRTPVIKEIISNGVLFQDAYTGIPAITNSMQAAIVSGAWPATTGNAYRYYDKATNTVIQFARENRAETIAEAAVRQGLKVASVNQFALEDRGTTIGDPDKPYIQAEGNEGSISRFDAAIQLIKGEPAGNEATQIQIVDIPRFIALYMDDLDGLGHNESPVYGIPISATEAGRLQAVLDRLEIMDAKLGEFIQACKDRGIYDNMTFILTTDHGMAPFGQQGTEPDEYGKSSLPDLYYTLQGLGYNVEVLGGGQSPNPDTDIVLVDVGLEVQLSFTRDYTEQDIQNIINAIRDKVYIGQIMEKAEMAQRGAIEGFADLLISPKSPYHFKVVSDPDKIYYARGQHDSLDEKAQHVFSLMWGKGINKGQVYTDRIYIIDFAGTMTSLLGIDKPADATGAVLNDSMDIVPPVITITGVCDGDVVKMVNNIEIFVNEGEIDEVLLNGEKFNKKVIASPGEYTLYVRASDAVGNISEEYVMFVIDKKAK